MHLLDFHEMTELIFLLSYVCDLQWRMYDHLPLLPYKVEGCSPSSIGMWQLPKVTLLLLSQRHWRKLFTHKILSLGLATLLCLVW